jgi:hypothetical protein
MAVDTWSPLTIGNGRWQGGTPTRPYTGLLDEVAVYTNKLSAAQVTNHYAAAFAPGAGYRQTVLLDQPLLYYRMDAASYVARDPLTYPTAINFGSAPVNGAYTGGVVPGGVPGPRILGLGTNRAAPINGVISCVDAGNDPAFNRSNRKPFSALLWFKTYPADGRVQTLISHGTNWAMNLDGTTGHVAWSLANNGQLTSTNLLNDGNWHMAAGVFDGNGSYLYVDGLLDSSAAATTGLAGEPGANLFLGGNADYKDVGSNQRHFAGAIAQAAFYTNTLTAVQVQRLYSVAAVPTISLERVGNNSVISYTGALLSSTNVIGPYTPVTGACSPYAAPPTNAQRFYRTEAQL